MPDEIESSGNCVPMQSKARERELKKKGWKQFYGKRESEDDIESNGNCVIYIRYVYILIRS